MNVPKKPRLPQIKSLVLINIFPIICFCCGISLLLRGAIISVSFAVSFVLLPLTAIALNLFLIFNGNRRKINSRLSLFIPLVFLAIWCVSTAVSSFAIHSSCSEDRAHDKYNELVSAIPIRFAETKSELPETVEYHKIDFRHTLLFRSETEYLICKYGDDEYSEEKENLGKRYVFQEKDIKGDISEYAIEPTVTVDGYTFRFLSFDEQLYGLDFPKKMILVAANDEKKEIVYMFFYDFDIDYIRSEREFILDDCGWKYLK